MAANHSRRPFRSFPFEPSRFPFFYGWVIIAVGTIGMVMSAPGQTVGVSAFTDSLIVSLGLSRSQLSLAYLAGTLASALLLPRIGRIYDRKGARLVGTVSVLGLAGAVVLLSFSARISTGVSAALGFLPGSAIAFAVITIGFFGVRFSGQGALSLSSRNMVMEWFEVRRGTANAIMGIAISFGFSFAPRVFDSLLQEYGWESAWRVIALILVVFAALAAVMYRDKPEAHGLKPDGRVMAQSPSLHAEAGTGPPFTVIQARRTYTFWIFALTLLLGSLVGTAYTFHIVSIFADAGIGRSQAVAVFFPASIVAVVIQTVGSWLSDRVRLRHFASLQYAGIAILCLGLLLLAPGWPVVVVIAGSGIMQGTFGINAALAWPRFFGRKHLGAISGFASALTVIGSAVGPYLFSAGRDISGSYSVSVIVIGVVAVFLFAGSFWANRPTLPE